jgi:hypothetical protein
MSFRRYKTGLNRQQAMLMPQSVDDYVSEINTVSRANALNKKSFCNQSIEILANTNI